MFSEPQPHLRGLVDITGLGWAPVTVTDDGIELAATCPLAQVSALSRRLRTERPDWAAAPLLHQCCTALLASFKIQATATVGGNICLSFPAGSMISLTAALDGVLTVWRPDGSDYRLPVTDFVTGRGRQRARRRRGGALGVAACRRAARHHRVPQAGALAARPLCRAW